MHEADGISLGFLHRRELIRRRSMRSTLTSSHATLDAMTAILALFIDILHDADTGVPDEISDRKLVDLPYVLNCFLQSEASKFPLTREVGSNGL